jgi:Mn-dependent DtxR family transcriptional regulator
MGIVGQPLSQGQVSRTLRVGEKAASKAFALLHDHGLVQPAGRYTWALTPLGRDYLAPQPAKTATWRSTPPQVAKTATWRSTPPP